MTPTATHNPKSTRHARAAGFTLVELICVTVILGALGAVTAGVISRAAAAMADSSVSARLCDEAGSAMELITRQLRSIPGKPGSSPAAVDISAMTAGSIQYAPSSSIALNGTQVIFSENGATAMPIANNVTQLLFEPMDNTGALITMPVNATTLLSVQRVRVTLTLQRGSRTETLRTTVFPRCLLAGAKP
ncbi:MAG: prepilin-type N-terminal cleavage/methylation domain-containing protein [Phycisphaerales bacterium]|nr:prepilin-type N-terminal cleavage/methylation domain-containing protein [Phycisphaerales bacterium]